MGFLRLFRRAKRRPAAPDHILVMSQLLLGDAIMSACLLKTLRLQYPLAKITLAVPPAIAPLYSGRPYNTVALAFSPRFPSTLWQLIKHGPYDLAFVLGDNRYSWTALAAGAVYIVGHQTTRPTAKNWPFNELKPYPPVATNIAECFAGLATSVLAPAALAPVFESSDWPAPLYKPFDLPMARYAVFHVGASKAQKLWPPANWQSLASFAEASGLEVIWSCGPGEAHLVDAIDPDHKQKRKAGTLDLPQLWHLVKSATVLVSPDTGVAHLAKLTGTPAIVMFGPASPTLADQGRFWSGNRYHGIVKTIPCRNHSTLFKRNVPWVLTCHRNDQQCPTPECMRLIRVEDVKEAVHAYTPRTP
jgi:ADP-heptose:LPS heptosyltransferase